MAGTLGGTAKVHLAALPIGAIVSPCNLASS